MQQTVDGGFIIAGTTRPGVNPNVPLDVYLVKTDSLGDSVWLRSFGDFYHTDEAFSVRQTNDGGYIVAGYTESFGAGGEDLYLIKTDSLGDTIWTRAYGGPSDDRGYSVQQTTDGGYIVAGHRTAVGKAGRGIDIYLIKTDASGDTLWTKTYGWAGTEYGYSVEQTTDGGYIVGGTTSSIGNGYYDFYLIKTDSLGDTLWTRTYGNASADMAYSAKQTSDGGYILAGFQYFILETYYDIRIIKTDSDGNGIWDRVIKEIGYAWVEDVIETFDGRYLAVCYKYTSGIEGSETYLVMLLEDGSLFWEATYGYAGDDYGKAIEQTADSGFIVTGSIDSDVYLLKLDPVGTKAHIWTEPRSFEKSLEREDMVTQKLPLVNRGDGTLHFDISKDTLAKWLAVTPETSKVFKYDSMSVYLTIDALDLEQGYYYDTLLISSNAPNDPEVNISVTLIVLPKDTTFVYPNPYVPKRGHNNITFANLPEAGKIEIYTIANRLVWEYAFSNIGKHYNWDVQTNNGSDVASGVYIYVIRNAQNKVLEKKKFAIIR